jgi:hypothetical protein
MRATIVGMLAAMLGLLISPGPLYAQAPDGGGIDAAKVNEAIAGGVSYLLKSEAEWNNRSRRVGVTALCALALITAGEPIDNPSIESTLDILRNDDKSTNIYDIAVKTMVLCVADPRRDAQIIRRNVALIEEMQDRESGGWAYSKGSNLVNSSTSQFALLALFEAERAGVSTSEATWRLAKQYWAKSRLPDGPWSYNMRDAPSGPSGSMTCAGIASMIMAREKLNEGDARVQDDRVVCCADRDDDSDVNAAMQWLSSRYSVSTNPGLGANYLLYYLYGLERVGRLTNRRLMGEHDWYREGADFLVARRNQLTGSWVGVGTSENEPLIATSLALLFLAKGRRPVVVAKLIHEPLHDWDHHRKDVDNLVRYCEKRWERDLTWQVMQMKGATVDDLLQAPVLFLSGSEVPKFDDKQIKTLRQYLDYGGFLFAENCCDDDRKEFDTGFRELMAKVFWEKHPDGQPVNQLRFLESDHAVWGAEEPVDPDYPRPLYGLNIGCRTNVIYSPTRLGCFWELDRLGRTTTYPKEVEAEIRAVRSIGINVLAYATNREVKYKLDIPPLVKADGKADAVERAKLYIAELRHNGGSGIAPTALVNLLRQLRDNSGMRVSTEKRELSLTQDSLFDHHLVFLHGRTNFTLLDAERKQLRAFVERGGMIFGDSICSSDAFTTAFRREMTLVFPDVPLKPIPVAHDLFTDKFGGVDLSRITLRDPRRGGAGPLRADVVQAPPELEGLQFGSRYGVIFSKYDLSCALERQNSIECAGYSRDDAAKIGINIILYSLRGNL